LQCFALDSIGWVVSPLVEGTVSLADLCPAAAGPWQGTNISMKSCGDNPFGAPFDSCMSAPVQSVHSPMSWNAAPSIGKKSRVSPQFRLIFNGSNFDGGAYD
jgi:hypothetical protein